MSREARPTVQSAPEEMRGKKKVKRGDPNIIHRRGKTRFRKGLYGLRRAYAGQYRKAL